MNCFKKLLGFKIMLDQTGKNKKLIFSIKKFGSQSHKTYVFFMKNKKKNLSKHKILEVILT